MKTWITNGYVYRYDKRRMERKDLCIEDGKICEICSPGHGEREGDVYDASGKSVIPGFIDVHTHGGCGVDVNDAMKDDFEKIGHFFALQGTTSWLCSILTDTKEQTTKCIHEALKHQKDHANCANLLGIHLEGPFLSVEFKGAMPEELLRKADMELLKEYQVEDGLVLDLGCGTGNMTELLAKEGYDMIGVDNSEDMLEIASEKRAESGLNILYLLQDMREFELYGTVKAVVSICDSINYILEEDDLREVFSLVNNYLDPKGMFIFDLNTKYKYEQMGETTIAENREEASFIWDNYYDPEEEINEYELAIFIPEGEDSDLYRKFEEVHYQRAYDLATIRRLLEEAGMEFVTAYDAFTKDAPRPESERIYVVAREKGKSEK